MNSYVTYILKKILLVIYFIKNVCNKVYGRTYSYLILNNLDLDFKVTFEGIEFKKLFYI